VLCDSTNKLTVDVSHAFTQPPTLDDKLHLLLSELALLNRRPPFPVELSLLKVPESLEAPKKSQDEEPELSRELALLLLSAVEVADVEAEDDEELCQVASSSIVLRSHRDRSTANIFMLAMVGIAESLKSSSECSSAAADPNVVTSSILLSQQPTTLALAGEPAA